MENQEIDPTTPVKEASPEVKKIIIEVLKMERERLYEHRPRLDVEVMKIIQEAVQ
jgi:hypothetical protein